MSVFKDFFVQHLCPVKSPSNWAYVYIVSNGVEHPENIVCKMCKCEVLGKKFFDTVCEKGMCFKDLKYIDKILNDDGRFGYYIGTRFSRNFIYVSFEKFGIEFKYPDTFIMSGYIYDSSVSV